MNFINYLTKKKEKKENASKLWRKIHFISPKAVLLCAFLWILLCVRVYVYSMHVHQLHYAIYVRRFIFILYLM